MNKLFNRILTFALNIRGEYYRRKLKDPKKIANLYYKRRSGRDINWDNPTDLNEWINWLKFNSDMRVWARLADKYEVREYVKGKGLEHILVNLYGVWDDPNKIDFSTLPNSFVLKSNHGAGTVKLIKDKSVISENKLKRECTKWLKIKFGPSTAEMHYALIKPRIIAEELLDATQQTGTSASLIDYKIWCFCGKPYIFFVISNRTKESIEVDCFDLNWQLRNDMIAYNEHVIPAKEHVPKPKSFDEMIAAATILSDGHPQVRVDLYEINAKPVFGEMTFTSNGGYMRYFTKAALLEMGNLIHI